MVTFFSSPDQRVKSLRKIILARENKYTFQNKRQEHIYRITSGFMWWYNRVVLKYKSQDSTQSCRTSTCQTCLCHMFRAQKHQLGPSIYKLVSNSSCLRPLPSRLEGEHFTSGFTGTCEAGTHAPLDNAQLIPSTYQQDPHCQPVAQ